MTPDRTPVVLIKGPTAAGKSGLALRLAEALAGEIVSVDACQVYRGLDLGTAKPTREERARVPHHLIDIREPDRPYSAADFLADAHAAIEDIARRGRLPLLVGGTMLYFRALQEGLSPLPPADPGLRARLAEEGARRGWPALHRRLAEVDPAAAARIRPTDPQRIQRALEIWELAGEPPSALQARGRAGRLRRPVISLALVPADRQWLHGRIAERFRAMLAAGLVEEVRGLLARGLDPALPALRSVGYRQAVAVLAGRLPAGELEARGIYATRQLAKRQLTWLRAESGLVRFDPGAAGWEGALRAHLERRLEALVKA